MKKLFAFVIVLAIFVTTFAFNVGSASAKPAAPPNKVPVVVLTHPLFNNLDGGTHIPASVNGKSISCYVTDSQKVRCVMPKKLGGERVTINMNIDGTYLNFSVKVPEVIETYYV